MGCSQKYDFVDRFSNENFQKIIFFPKVWRKKIEYKNSDFIVFTKNRRWSDLLSGGGEVLCNQSIYRRFPYYNLSGNSLKKNEKTPKKFAEKEPSPQERGIGHPLILLF